MRVFVLRPRSTAVAENSGEIWKTVCAMTLPSVEAKNLYSTRCATKPFVEKTPATFFASSLARRRRSSFSATGTWKGSFATGVVYESV